MVMNPDYDLARPLASALKAKAPYVGIPIPGHAPLIFSRDKLQAVLRGVKPIYIAVTIHDNGERSLTVEGVAGPRCRTFMRIRSLSRQGFYNCRSDQYQAMEKWNPAKQNKPRSRTAKYDKAIAKLERQLAKLGNRPHICNPCLSYSEVSKDYRAQFLSWHQQKDLRRKIGYLGVAVRAGKITAREFYAQLAQLTTVKRYSDFTPKERERLLGKIPWGHNGFFFYADPKNLWKFLPDVACSWQHSRPKLYWNNWEEWEKRTWWGSKRYEPVLEWSHSRQELLSQIAATRAIADDAKNVPNFRSPDSGLR